MNNCSKLKFSENKTKKEKIFIHISKQFCFTTKVKNFSSQTPNRRKIELHVTNEKFSTEIL